ncbi:MAG: PilX N-terminal domain-containing pilus assembly protein [Thiobacillaceae bacterium]
MSNCRDLLTTADVLLKVRPSRGGERQKGFVLVISLLLLVVLTILAVSMFRTFGLQEIMSGNLREKTRAVDAAQTAIRYAEWWLTQGNNATTGAACVVGGANPVVCNTAIVNPTSLPWGVGLGVSYNPNAQMTVNAGGGNGNYFQAPQYYIQYVGLAAGGAGELYRITAAGWGGNSTAVAVLQSTYIVSTGNKNVGGP